MERVLALASSSPLSRRVQVIAIACIFCVGALVGAETKPVLGPGATRDEVIDAYGWPNGQSRSGDREIFSYQQGRVVMKDGLVERMDFSPNVAWPVPRPRPKGVSGAQTRTLGPEKPVVIDPWFTDFEKALEEATRRGVRILALFTGTDWSPASKKFQEEIALHPDFLNTVGREYVLLKLDYPRNTTQPAALHEQNAVLRERFAVTTYPTAILLTTEGREFGRADLTKERPQSTYREQIIAAVEEANPTPASAAWLASADRPPAAPVPAPVATHPRTRMLWFVGIGAVAIVVAGWALWRRREPGQGSAFGGARIPTEQEIAAWPHLALRNVCAHLFGAEGKRVDLRVAESGADLVVHASAEKDAAKTLVRCLSGTSGPADLSSARDLLGTMIAEGVQTGWFVAPAGFSAETRTFAINQGITLLTAEELRSRLQSVPRALLSRVLAPAA